MAMLEKSTLSHGADHSGRSRAATALSLTGALGTYPEAVHHPRRSGSSLSLKGGLRRVCDSSKNHRGTEAAPVETNRPDGEARERRRGLGDSQRRPRAELENSRPFRWEGCVCRTAVAASFPVGGIWINRMGVSCQSLPARLAEPVSLLPTPYRELST